jgi:starvation-inducible DNA-binding protein
LAVVSDFHEYAATKGNIMSDTESHIGIPAEGRAKIADGLAHVLADTYSLYLKTHNFHWNVTGPMFTSLHAMFMTQYNELWLATDEIAERIRALGHFAPGSYSAFGKLTSIKEAPEQPPEALEMVKQLAEGHEAVARTARKIFSTVEDAGDEVSVDLLVTRMQYHEKTAWMLRSILG